MSKKLQVYLCIFIAFSTIIGTAFGLENYFAKQRDVELVAMRLEQKIVSDKLYDLQNQIFKLESTHNCSGLLDCQSKMSPIMLEQYRWILIELEKEKNSRLKEME